jgi:TolB protein
MRRVTDDPPRDRAPVFTPDGRSLVFYSNRGGDWGGWIIGVDGGNLRPVATQASSVVYPLISPQGNSLVFQGMSGKLGVFTVSLGADAGAAVSQLATTATGDRFFNPTSWSSDGARLAGYLTTDSGRPAGVATYDLQSQTTTMLAPDETVWVRWLADNRRIVYFTKGGWELVVLDSVTHVRAVVDVRLPAPATTETFAVSPDNRTIYYGGARAEADIWIVERP